jgi:biopolymer transport protein ExbD
MLKWALGFVIIALLSGCERSHHTGPADFIPPSVGAADKKLPNLQHIVLRRDGQVNYDGQITSVEAAVERVAARAPKDKLIYISAEPGADVDYARVLEVMGFLKAAGFDKIGLVGGDSNH